jgi:elongation factor Ts
MEIAATEVKKLRDLTGMPFGKCRDALIKCEGNVEKAIDHLRSGNKDVHLKLEGRETAEGRIGVFIDPAEKVGAIIEVRCESAPVVKSDLFIQLSADLAKQVAMMGATTPEELLAQPYVDDPAKTVQARIQEVIGLIRENMKPARMVRRTGLLGGYVHHNGASGAIVEVEGASADPQLLREVCMHITAVKPVAAVREQVPKEKIEKEMEIARAQALETGKNKPANIIDKIAEGKLKTWFAENVLAEQPFVKDPSKTVGDLLRAAGLKLIGFTRLEVGQVS